MFNSDRKFAVIEQQLDQLSVATQNDTVDLENRIIAVALQSKPSKPKLLGVGEPRRFSIGLIFPIAACVVLTAVLVWMPNYQSAPETPEVVAFDELQLQEMWLLQDELLFDELNR